MVKVSIVVPVFNVEKYLAECLDSIIQQTLKEIEIICVNDGSTDSSLKILKEYGEIDSRIIVIDKKNSGYGNTMNVGIEKATGEYIGIVESDDFVPLNMYENLYNKAKENGLDFIKADFYRFTRDEKNGNMSLIYYHLSKNINDYNKIFNPSENPSTLLYIMNTWSGIYRHQFLIENNIKHNETPGASFQDIGFWIQTFCFAKKAMTVDKPYYMNRRDNPNSSVKNKEKVYCAKIEYEHIKNILMKNSEIWSKFKYMYTYRKFHTYTFTVNRIARIFKKDYCIYFSEEMNKAKDLEELDISLFRNFEKENLELLMKNPMLYYKENVIMGDKFRKIKDELRNVKSSICVISKSLIHVPCGIKRYIRRKFI